jgi:hypothetical protein
LNTTRFRPTLLLHVRHLRHPIYEAPHKRLEPPLLPAFSTKEENHSFARTIVHISRRALTRTATLTREQYSTLVFVEQCFFIHSDQLCRSSYTRYIMIHSTSVPLTIRVVPSNGVTKYKTTGKIHRNAIHVGRGHAQAQQSISKKKA